MKARPIEPEQAIEIRPVGNGFFVSGARDVSRGSSDDPLPLVFQSMQALVGFLAAHFSHRCQHVAADQGDGL